MASVVSAITNTIPITQFNRGLAGKIFEDVKRNGAKVEEYVRLMDEVNDARLLTIATERMVHYDPATVISEAEMNRRLGITAEDLADFDEVDIE